jgi:hypothetical protein
VRPFPAAVFAACGNLIAGRYYFLPLICFIVALLLHPKVASNNFLFNTLWAFRCSPHLLLKPIQSSFVFETNTKPPHASCVYSTYLECLSLLPQVLKIQGQLKSEQGKGKVLAPSYAPLCICFSSMSKPVDPAVANYIAALFVSRILEGCFWIIALCPPPPPHPPTLPLSLTHLYVLPCLLFFWLNLPPAAISRSTRAFTTTSPTTSSPPSLSTPRCWCSSSCITSSITSQPRALSPAAALCVCAIKPSVTHAPNRYREYTKMSLPIGI